MFEEILLVLKKVNEDYFKKYGFIFIICVMGLFVDIMLNVFLVCLFNLIDEEIIIVVGE